MSRMTTTWILTCALAGLTLLAMSSGPAPGASPSQDEFAQLRSEAEARYAEGSFELARRIYARTERMELTVEQRRWSDFRLADTAWRSAASTDQQDASAIEAARKALEALAPADTREERRDRVWAEVQESLADLRWDRPGSQDWGAARPLYRAACEWWGAAQDVELARERFLGMVWTMAQPRWHQRHYGHRVQPNWIDVDLLEDAVRVATEREDQARAELLLATKHAQAGRNPMVAGRALRAFARAVELSEGTPWRDDALFGRAQFLEQTGVAERDDEGQWTWRADFVASLADYRSILTEFKKGATPYHDDARNRIRDITRVDLNLSVERFFLPGSVAVFDLNWRNTRRIDLELHPVSLLDDVVFEGEDDLDWLRRLDLDKRASLRRWSFETEDEGKHEPGRARQKLEGDLPVGAYVLVARTGSETRRELVLVGDLAVTVKSTPDQLLAWTTDALTGRPVPEARVLFWQRWYDGSDWRLRQETAVSGPDGVAVLPIARTTRWWNWYVAAEQGARQTFATSGGPRAADSGAEWKIHTQTDRPAYRPGEEVQWRFLARQRRDGDWSTPQGESVHYEVRDPRGQSIAEGTAEWNAFGAAWGSLTIPEDAALGEFRVQFHRLDARGKKREAVTGVTLFRLEEYKLPEFEVSVTTTDPESGAPRAYVVGDRIEFDVQATYYFGAPVQEATVEVLVHQKPWWFQWQEERSFPWLREEQHHGRHWWGGPGQQVLSTTVVTDAQGRARVTLDTPMDSDSDLEYSVEARVVDASRREVVGAGTVRVTRQEHYAHAKVDHQVHRPGAKVEVLFETRDPNGSAVGARGLGRVLRQRYVEVWRDREGREWRGPDRFRLVRPGRFTAPADARAAGWTLQRGGYEEEEVASSVLETDPETGRVRWSFTPPREGTYRVRWIGRDSRRVPVDAECTLWVCGDETRELGYRPGQLELLLDEDTVAPGGQATVVLTAPSSNRWVLFTVEGETLFEHRVVHLDGAVKLVRVDVSERHTPNVWLQGVTVFDGNAWSDTKELIVPPLESLLTVEVVPEEEAVEPGSEGALLVTVRDQDGQPVEVELALAVYDRALEAIQSDLAQEVQRFFHGDRQALRVQLGGSFQMRSFVKLEEEDGVIQESAWNEQLKEVEQRQVWMGARLEQSEGLALRDDLAALGYSGTPVRSALAAVPESQTASLGKSLAGRRQSNSFGQVSDALDMEGAFEDGAGSPGRSPEVRVRADFRKTALWLPDVRTDSEGRARVTVPFPDSTTRWRAVARGADTGLRVGQGDGDVRTRQPLIARLQAPRFLQADDELTISANLMNAGDEELRLRPVLEVDGPVQVLGHFAAGAIVPLDEAPVIVPAGGETRVDWRVAVVGTGSARLTLKAAAESGESDGMELTLPVVPRGIEALVATSGRMTGEELTATLRLPADRAGTTLEVQVTPSLAATMLDALPYLIDYPYGCVEQTLSRFLPSVIVARTLESTGVSAETVLERAFGGVEERFADRTHPAGKQALEELDRMVEEGLARLYDMQHGDGGWGWWKSGSSDPFMTAYVVWGLSLAREAGVEVRPGALANAAGWLSTEVVEAESQPDLAAWILHALAAWGGELDAERAGYVDAAYERLAEADRTRLNAMTRALLALACHASGRTDEARRLVDNLLNGVVIDESPDTSIVARDGGASSAYVLKTAHWGSDGVWRRWSEGPVEATAVALRALLAIQPDHELVEPVTNWLVKNRRGAQWSNTRDTAMAVLALTDRLAVTGEVSETVGFEVLVNGTPVGSRLLEPEQLLAAPTRLDVDPGLLRDGQNEVTLRRTAGDAPLYFAAYARFFDSSRPIEARGNELFVRRQYYRLTPRETLLAGTVYDRVPLLEGGSVESGDRVEVVVTFEAKNDLEYLVFEDLKPAGFEAVGLQSGTPATAYRLTEAEARARFGAGGGDPTLRAGGARDPRLSVQRGEGLRAGTTGERRGLHQELRDRHIASFVDRLPQGTWELRYELRAEVPGAFIALPVLGNAMYVPEIAANGRDQALVVLDRGKIAR